MVNDFDLSFRPSLATAQTNRFALRLARNSAKTGHIVPLAGVYANGTLVVLLLGVRRGPTRRNAIAIPISFEPKQERICFSAKGAAFSASLGQRPRIRGTPKQRQR